MIAHSLPVVAGSWTTGPASANAAALAHAIAVQSSDISGVNLVLCPPFASLSAVRTATGVADIALGAPAIQYKNGMGELTSELKAEVSAVLLSTKFDYVIIGHWKWQEDNEIVALETAAALAHGIKPIICVGETADQRQSEPTAQTIRRQVLGALSLVSDLSPRGSIAIAYQPVWALRSRRAVEVTADETTQVLGMIRTAVAERWGEETATATPLLYGGNVTADNAAALASVNDIGGVLLSDDSLGTETFIAMARAFSGATPAVVSVPSPEPAHTETNQSSSDRPDFTDEQQAVRLLLKRSLLPVITELESALRYLDEREAQGLQLIQDKLRDFQEWEHISRVGELGERFDPDIHRAIGTDERVEYPSRVVVEVLQPGYRVEDHVVQKAEVIVNR